MRCKSGGQGWGRSGLPTRGGEAKRDRETSPFPIRGGKTVSPIRGGIKMSDGKMGLGSFPSGGEGEGIWNRVTDRGEIWHLPA